MKYQAGMIIKMEGCPVKKENGVFEIDRLWENNNSAFVYKLKKNGERVKGVKNSLNIFKFSHMDKYGTIISKKELSTAISQVNKSLKEVKENETVYTYQATDRKELQKGDFIKVVKPIQTISSIYAIPTGFIYSISACEGQNANRYFLKRIGKKGQVLSGNSGTHNIISFSAKTIEKLFAEGYIMIVEQVEQTRKEMIQQTEQQKETKEQSEQESNQLEQESQTEITAVTDDNGYIMLTNEQAAELEKRFIYNKATKQEEQLLRQYHLQLQERAMQYKASLPSNYEELIDDNAIYKVVSCFPVDGGSAGIYEIEITGKKLKDDLWTGVYILNIITPLEAEQRQPEPMEQEQTTEQPVNEVITANLNSELQGVEIRFNEKPAQEVIEQLKANGYRWSKRGFWYAKQTEKTLAFAQSLSGQIINNSDTITASTQEQQAYTYPEIDIDDLDQYTVSDELQRRLHSNSLFTVDYKRDCALTFQNIQNEALEALSLTDDPRMIYHIKKYLQSFKKRYYEQYLKILNHKANNPSWMVTGRGGLNVRRYNKMQDRYDKLLGESVKLSEEFKRKIQDFKWQIQDEKQRQWREKINNSLNDTELKEVFTVEKKPVTVAGYTETVRTYNYNGYTIAKTWGKYRIFSKDGKEIETTLKTSDKLADAKRYVLMLVKQNGHTEQAI